VNFSVVGSKAVATTSFHLSAAVFLSIFQPIHLFSINQPITTFHGTGLNVPVLKRLISIIQPCPRYKVKCPCVGHRHIQHQLIIQPSSVYRLNFQRSLVSFIWVTTRPFYLTTFLSLHPNNEAKKFHALSHSELVYINFRWVVSIFNLYMHILVLYIGGGYNISKFFSRRQR